MSYEGWVILFGIVISNSFVLIGGVIYFATQLTEIKTDLKWVKKNCPQCQQTSENHTT